MHERFTPQIAEEIARQAHEGQLCIDGSEYILHPITVMNMMEDEDTKMAVVLHDVPEDTEYEIEKLRKLGCPEHVLEAVLLVTHDPDYNNTEEEYIAKIQKIANSGNQLAIDVKWGDLTHNSDMSRIPDPTPYDFQRLEKYKKSKEILQPVVSKYLREI